MAWSIDPLVYDLTEGITGRLAEAPADALMEAWRLLRHRMDQHPAGATYEELAWRAQRVYDEVVRRMVPPGATVSTEQQWRIHWGEGDHSLPCDEGRARSKASADHNDVVETRTKVNVTTEWAPAPDAD